MIGIYCITNKINKRRYIGSSVDIYRRFKEHQSDLRCGSHANSFLQNSFRKHGEDSFLYEIIEQCDKEILIDREEFWILQLQSFEAKFGYNFSPYPKRPRLGKKASPETLAKMSASNSGENHPNWGKKLSSSHVRNIALGQSGIKKPSSGRKKTYSIINPQGDIVVFTGLRKFCRDNRLNTTCILKLVKGTQEYHNKWRSVVQGVPIKGRGDRAVCCFCDDKEYRFLSMGDAGRSKLFDKKVSPKNISNCCRGRVKFCGKINGKLATWKYS